VLGTIKNQQGISLLVLVIMVVLVGIAAVGITAFLIQSIALSLSEKDRARSLYLAEAGLADSFWELLNSRKLYGPPSQPFGQIDQQTINFFDGTNGAYLVPQPNDSIVSTGTYNSIVRKVRVKLSLSPKDYVLFSGEKGDFRFAQRCQVEGNVFVNGNVRVRLPSNIDTTKMKLYLPKGNSAQYENGRYFPYISLEPPPFLPALDTYYYDSLLVFAQKFPRRDTTWNGSIFLPGSAYFINGNLTIRSRASISCAGSSCTIVVTGRIRMIGNQLILVGNNIRFISGEEISLQGNNITVGLTTGRSGNLLYSNKVITIYNTNLINGSVVSPQIVSIGDRAIVNGFIYAGNTAQVGQQVSLNGAIWAGNFSDEITVGTTGSRVNFIWRGDYLPSPLPRGIAEVKPNVKLLANSWKEIK
jgi:hypothetical protein